VQSHQGQQPERLRLPRHQAHQQAGEPGGVLRQIPTGGGLATRIANAKLDPTFLMADVELVATYKLYDINRTKLEKLIHRVFDRARLDIEIKYRFGKPVIPREWFVVPVFVVDEAVQRIKDGTITRYVYDPKTATLVEAGTR